MRLGEAKMNVADSTAKRQAQQLLEKNVGWCQALAPFLVCVFVVKVCNVLSTDQTEH